MLFTKTAILHIYYALWVSTWVMCV